MPDREKVIKGLECCVTMPDIYPRCEECPYADAKGTCANMNGLHRDALALLKAQEPREMSDAELMDAIRKAPIMLKPAVDAAPVVHGRWEPTTHGFPPEPTTVCSNCGLDIDYEICKRIKADSFSYTSIRPSYCPALRREDDGGRTWEP